MLSLKRKEGQSINVYTADGVITIHVGQHRNGHIQLSFDAPPQVVIMRDEIDDQKRRLISPNLLSRLQKQLIEFVRT